MSSLLEADMAEVDALLSAKGWLSQNAAGAFIFHPISESPFCAPPPVGALTGDLRTFIAAGLLPSHGIDNAGEGL